MRLTVAVTAVAVCMALRVHALPIVEMQTGRTAQAGDCVAIGTPKPGVSYHYSRTQSNGGTTQTSHQWESVTPSGSRLKAVGAAGPQIQVNEHTVVDDVAVLTRTSRQSAAGAVLESTSFAPGIPTEPIFRACTGRSWAIPAATATFQAQQKRATAQGPAGSLKIVSIRERITVPAGTFETVRYTRSSQSNDEYWKSIEHGVMVKHIATLTGITITETLTAIK